MSEEVQPTSGRAKLAWVRPRMPVLAAIRQRWQQERPLSGERVAMSLHLEAKTAMLALLLAEGGATVRITSSNPLSAQDDVAAALAEQGVEVFARRGTDAAEFDRLHHQVLDIEPTLLLDDGGELVERVLTTRRALIPAIKGGAEETTTGVVRLRALARDNALPFPMVAVNDAPMKHLFDNRYGTGQSTWDAIMRHTNLSVAGATTVVAGYGWCGRGVAERARGLGSHVIVTEVDPVRALEAWMDGFRVAPMADAIAEADFVITVTGSRGVVRGEHFLRLKEGAVLANAGHFDVEIDMAWLRQHAEPAGIGRDPDVMGWRLPNGRVVYVVAEGRLANLAAGDGHPIEIMDLTFGLQALTLERLAHGSRPPGLYPVDPAVNEWVARERLRALGTAIDQLSAEQVRYLNSWRISDDAAEH
jgi:adenosylhomocysteinase